MSYYFPSSLKWYSCLCSPFTPKDIFLSIWNNHFFIQLLQNNDYSRNIYAELIIFTLVSNHFPHFQLWYIVDWDLELLWNHYFKQLIKSDFKTFSNPYLYWCIFDIYFWVYPGYKAVEILFLIMVSYIEMKRFLGF